MLNTTGLHPAFAAIIERASATPTDLRIAAYRSALQRFDWAYQYSDDGRVYERARDRYAALRHEASQIDPDWEVWNSVCPVRCANGASAI